VTLATILRGLFNPHGFRAVGLTVAVLLLVLIWAKPTDAANDRLRLFARSQTPPSLDGGYQWLNVAGPLRLEDLRGKFVVLDFWTYCCINCMHILPELEKLEEAYPNNVVVIGIHSAKFATERDEDNIREAILRHDIRHPVLVDSNLQLWRRWNVNVWPSLMVIDPEGNWIAKHEGEIKFEAFDEMLKRAVPNFRQRGSLDETPLKFALEKERREPTPLLFPGKVLADEANRRLFIADSAHHRIVVADWDGKLQHVVGSGEMDLRDGDFATAAFDHPQGMVLYEDKLLVADVENHAIREIDFDTKQVTTIAGTGEQAKSASTRAASRATGTDLASPWDLTVHENKLYVAMAGSHQIWRMTLPRGRIDSYAGNGVEDIVDGPLSPRVAYQTGFASFAQPSGIATDGTWLYIADSEGSSIRAVPIDPRGQVVTVLGTAKLPDGRLFTFGDRDGPTATALLQHPVGIDYRDGQLFVADTYNNKVKLLDLNRRGIVTIAGDGKSGAGNSPAQFNEPMGLSVASDRIFVADTNNHLIRVIDRQNENRVSTLSIKGLRPPEPPEAKKLRIPPADTKLTFGPTELKPSGNEVRVSLELSLPTEYKLNAEAPFGYYVQLAGDEPLFDNAVSTKRQSISNPTEKIEFGLPLAKASGKERIRITLTYFYCREDAQAVCKIGNVSWTGQIVVSPQAGESLLRLEHTVQ
ncbi:MAG: redoxin domain-containing protein, partial [Planctomycetales bacterium]|nr:redoxin domain-containing protein [Planctomycetales bacterium]